MRIKPLILTVSLNKCLHWTQNLVIVPCSIAIRYLVSKISRSSVHYSSRKIQ
jgi:hypothetical protein